MYHQQIPFSSHLQDLLMLVYWCVIKLIILTSQNFLQGGIEHSLCERFQELRHPKKSDQSRRSLYHHQFFLSQSANKTFPGKTCPLSKPQIPPGEDKAPFERHNNALLLEFRKSNPNMTVVNCLTDAPLAMRWKDIHEKQAFVMRQRKMPKCLRKVKMMPTIVPVLKIITEYYTSKTSILLYPVSKNILISLGMSFIHYKILFHF